MDALKFLIGTWKTIGEMKEVDNTTTPFEGADSYEWILEGQFILHKVDVSMNNEKVEAIEIIGGLDVKTKRYKMRSFDNQGVYTEMEAYIDDAGVLHIVGDKMRAKLVAGDGNNMVAHWDRSEDNQSWESWMDVRFSKII